eukprot:10887742-Prorocentrum_lima.AAC.1
MQIVTLKGEDIPPGKCIPCHQLSKSNNDEWEWRGKPLIRHRRRPIIRAYSPDWRSTELSQFE